jgi:hypothetical protein
VLQLGLLKKLQGFLWTQARIQRVMSDDGKEKQLTLAVLDEMLR